MFMYDIPNRITDVGTQCDLEVSGRSGVISAFVLGYLHNSYKVNSATRREIKYE